jgi:hypothetical protein
LLLSELSDVEVIILRAYTMDHGEEAEEFFEKHQQVVSGPIVTMESARDEINKEIIHKTHRAFLARLGLLRPHFMGLKKGELPQFDKSTGTFKTNNYQITPLGRLLLRHIDLIE